MTRTHRAGRPTAPNDLKMPQYVTTWLGRRDRSVIAHGFTEAELKPTWWTNTLRSAGLAPGETFTVAAPSTVDDVPKLTRGTLFDMAGGLDADSDDPEWLAFLWHVLAWGSGWSRRNNRDRIHAFVDPESRKERVSLLRDAAKYARSGDPRGAYSVLIRRGGGKIPALGPAFFTKFLYFVSENVSADEGSSDGRRCLIFDARVARSLHAAGWTTLHRGQNFSANWYTDTYVSYCDLLHRWATERTEDWGTVVAPDELERAIFAGRAALPSEAGS
jgi:hypothetical protein